MFAYRVRDDVGEMSGDVFAAFRRSQPHAVKPGNLNVWRAREIETVVEIEPIAREVEVCIEVAEDLAEVVYAGQQLIRYFRRKGGVPGERVVRYVYRSDLIVVLQLGSGLSQRGTADRGDLISLTGEVVKGDVVLVV